MQELLSIYALDRYGINQSKAQQLLELGRLKSWLIINGEAVKFDKLRDIPQEHLYGVLLHVMVDEEEIQSYVNSRKSIASAGEKKAMVSDINTESAKRAKSDKELCENLKGLGLLDDEIAKKLKQEFPEIKPSRIGRLLPANPGTIITSGALPPAT